MGFTIEDKYVIKSLRENRRYGAKCQLNMFPNKDWNFGALKVLIDTKVPLIDIWTLVDLSLSAQLLSSTKLKICYYARLKESRRHTEMCAVCLRHLKQAFYSIFFIFSQRLNHILILKAKTHH